MNASGRFSSPRNNPGFQTKKNSVGKRTAAPPNSEIAGMAVNMGNGEITEGGWFAIVVTPAGSSSCGARRPA